MPGQDSAIGMLTLRLDPASKTMDLTVSSQPGWKSAFTYELPDPDHLVLDGNLNGRPLKMRLHRVDLTRFLLLNRGFHMVNQSMLKR